MGTPEFAVAPLRALLHSGAEIAGVVTAPDKPAGRGKKLQSPAVKQFAIENLDCPVFQPSNLKDPVFIEELRQLDAQVFAVVAFRMLPEAIWSMPEYGTINLHASLLPQYRGAAPINWAIINGEKQSGVTTFIIDREIDTGRILLQESLEIEAGETAGSLHDKLMNLGSGLLVKTIEQLVQGNIAAIDQDKFNIPADQLKKAPKIFREDCRINWNKDGRYIHNFIRGLSPFPGAFTMVDQNNSGEMQVKILETRFLKEPHHDIPGSIVSDNRKYLNVRTGNGSIEILSLQAAGKKRMSAGEYLRGLKEGINGSRYY